MNAAARIAFLFCLFGLVLPKGSVPLFTAEFFVVLFAGLLILSAFQPSRSPAIEQLSRRALLMLSLLALYAIFQTIQIGEFGVANAIWPTAETALGISSPQTISVSPGQSWWSLPRAVLPFVVFVSAAALFRDEADHLVLWKAASIFGAIFVLYGALQFFLFPDWLLFEQKIHYRTSLTSALVNRNSAATLIGLTFFASAGVFVHAINTHHHDRSVGRSNHHRPSAQWSPVAITFLVFMAIQFVGLILTTSRGGFLSTMVGAVVFLSLLRFPSLGAHRLTPFLKLSGVAIGVLLFVDLFAGRVLYRIETSGVDESRLCTFQSTWNAAIDTLPFGSGLGTFMDVFPMYRDPACGLSGAWDMAHNTYLEMFLELGLAYPILLAFGGVLVVRTLNAGLSERRRYRPFIAAGCGMVVLVASHSLVDFSLQIPAVSALFAALLASSMALAVGRRPTEPVSHGEDRAGRTVTD